MLRERIVDLSGKVIDGLRDRNVQAAAADPAMAERVAGIIQERAAWLLQSLK
jgi:hypothetical protein